MRSSASASRRSPRRKRPSPCSRAWEGRRPRPTAPICKNTAWDLSTNQPVVGHGGDRGSFAAGVPGRVDGRERDGGPNAAGIPLPPKGRAAPVCSAWPCRPPRPWPASPVRVSRPLPPRFSDSDSRHARPASTTPACAAGFAAASPTSRAGCSMKTARSANGPPDRRRAMMDHPPRT